VGNNRCPAAKRRKIRRHSVPPMNADESGDLHHPPFSAYSGLFDYKLPEPAYSFFSHYESPRRSRVGVVFSGPPVGRLPAAMNSHPRLKNAFFSFFASFLTARGSNCRFNRAYRDSFFFFFLWKAAKTFLPFERSPGVPFPAPWQRVGRTPPSRRGAGLRSNGAYRQLPTLFRVFYFFCKRYIRGASVDGKSCFD